ncbi:MAG: YdeI/OmpD-associated family protein [Anaerolineae bacterium]|nr:YdeI/OmpD-associated family protein [Anaerolineae bacterium]
MAVNPTNPLEFATPEQWRAWLEVNHASAAEAWLILYKVKYADQGMTLEDATVEAMCYGWVDSVLKSLDERRYALRYTPRKPNSVWSMSNIRRVEQLTAEGRMADAGLRAVAEAKANGQWDAAIRREQVDVIPEALEAALSRVVGGIEGYHALPFSRKKQIIYWLQSAKTKTTKQTRIQRVVAEIIDSIG